MASASWDPHGEAQAALRAIVSDPQYGTAALSSAQTMTSLLKDLLPDAPRETSVLIAAAEAGLADSLRNHLDQGMDAGTATRLVAGSFEDRTALTPQACTWVTGALATALGVSAPSAGPQETPAGGAWRSETRVPPPAAPSGDDRETMSAGLAAGGGAGAGYATGPAGRAGAGGGYDTRPGDGTAAGAGYGTGPGGGTGSGYDTGPGRPARRRRIAVPLAAAAAVIVAVGVAVGLGLGLNGGSSPHKHKRHHPSPSPTSPSVTPPIGADQALVNRLNGTYFNTSECSADPDKQSGVTAVAAVNCFAFPFNGNVPALKPLIVQLPDASTTQQWFLANTSGFTGTGPNASCVSGLADGIWTHTESTSGKKITEGSLGCGSHTRGGATYYRLVWTFSKARIGVIADGSSSTSIYAWWVHSAYILASGG